MVEALVERIASWLAGAGPEAGVAVMCHCSLVRNMADFVFPAQCTDEQKRAVEERVGSVFAHLGLLSQGTYCSLPDLDPEEKLLLAEHRLIPFELLASSGPRGAYISDDQGLTIAVNGFDHLCLTALGSGLQVQETWNRVSVLDDQIGQGLDYAFHARFGYLTSSLAHTGTGLKAGVVLHLPALVMANLTQGPARMMQRRNLALLGFKPCEIRPADLSEHEDASTGANSAAVPEGGAAQDPGRYAGKAFFHDLGGAMYGDMKDAQGDLFLLTNLATLGASEEEILFRLRQGASEIIKMENEARAQLQSQSPRRLKDRVARAAALVRNARLVGFEEGVSLLSSLRLGVALGMIQEHTFQDIHELLLSSQAAHLRRRIGQAQDEWALSAERADLFRARFAQEAGTVL